tara:strand:+ start:88 stop:462 length:375 start_codon:yes stop_codon:yes gene_type:complete
MNLARYADRAQRNKIARRTFHERVRNGMDPEIACTAPVGSLPTSKPISEVYKRAMARGVSYDVCRHRRSRGWTDWEICNIPMGFTKRKYYASVESGLIHPTWANEADDISDEHKDGLLFKGVEV